ncbi:hypothetical protein [Novipirellula artificiosorum]|uniref:Lipoprotein n=1 Tax=Novipirellula artificiosorum TaxID=2528016 RepID=A0A5C6E0H9_9BACT|nr:hypothetical protein [Novipirellula artificiosorum]TWU40659.1 hypothetical protein Poly41_14940 [Novipirellula artificiosorum]
MKKNILTLLFTGLLFGCTSGQAQEIIVDSGYAGHVNYGAAPIVRSYSTPYQAYRAPLSQGYAAPAYSNYPAWNVRQPSQRGGFFSDLMTLERRKNAWLRRTFLGQ